MMNGWLHCLALGKKWQLKVRDFRITVGSPNRLFMRRLSIQNHQMSNRIVWAIFSTIFGMVSAVLLATAAPTRNEPVIAKVAWSNFAELNQLRSDYNVDVWQVFPNEKVAHIAADATALAQLQSDGWQFSPDPELTTFHFRHLAQTADNRAAETYFGGYKTNAEILAELQALNTQFPDLTELIDYGDSLCKQLSGCETPNGDLLSGHDLLALRITNEAITGTSQISGTTIISGSKPVFMLHGGIHAREIAVPEISLRFARYLLENYRSHPGIHPIIDYQESWIIPIANPDGYDVVLLGTQPQYGSAPLLHRKNVRGASPTGCEWPSTVSNQLGVDLNRNHSFGWGPIGTSSSPCSQVFKGAGGGSEPETVAFETLLTNLIPDQRGENRTDAAPGDTTGLLVTMHSYGEVIIWPWGDGIFPNNLAPNHNELKAIGDRLALEAGYTSLQGNDFGGVSGATEDHAYGVLGIPSFTFEIGTTFLQPYAETTGRIWDDNRPTLLYAASIARTPYQTVFGPELSNLTYRVQSDMFVISGTISDEKNGNSPIAAVSAQSSAPFTISSTTTYTATAADGAFDSVSEQFNIGPIPFEDASEDNPCPAITVYLRGSDQQGQDGPISGIIAQAASCGFSYDYYFPFVSQK